MKQALNEAATRYQFEILLFGSKSHTTHVDERSLPAIVLVQGRQTFLPEGRISYFTTVRGPDILRNMIASGMLHPSISTHALQIYYFFIVDKMSSRAWWSGFSGRMWSAGRSLENPVLVS